MFQFLFSEFNVTLKRQLTGKINNNTIESRIYNVLVYIKFRGWIQTGAYFAGTQTVYTHVPAHTVTDYCNVEVINVSRQIIKVRNRADEPFFLKLYVSIFT